MKIEEDVYVNPASILECPNVTIKRGSRVNGPMIARGTGSLTIGQFCAIGWGLHVVTSNHHVNGPNIQRWLGNVLEMDAEVIDKDVVIGDNCWLGDNVMMTPGAQIGAGCVVGMGAVVTAKFPPFVVLMGNPAVIKYERFSRDVVHQLLNIVWWNWTMEKIEASREFFELDLTAHGAVTKLDKWRER